DVFKSYKVVHYFGNGSISSSQEYKVLESLVGGKGIKVQSAARGMVIRVGMIYLDILNPKNNNQYPIINNQTDGDNDQSIVILLIYDRFKALFTGDAETEVSDLIATRPEMGEVNYLKVNHHGSKNGLSEKLIHQAVSGSLPRPIIGVISAGKNNRYGHPHKEVLDLLKKYNVKILRTDEVEDVVIKTDGNKFWSK
ncbi:MAG: hypothetical protein AAB778_01805, partial [Patescibacteria group bacterium]